MPRDLIVWCSPKDSPSSRWMESGQGLITRTVIDCPDINTTVISPTTWSYFYAIIRLFVYVFSRSSKSFSIYVVSSRTIPGFLRDVPAFIPIFFKCRVHAHVHGADIQELFAKPLLGFFAFRFYRQLTSVIFPSLAALPQGSHELTNSFIIENCLPLSVCSDHSQNPVSGSCNLSNHGSNAIRMLWNSNLMASKGLVEVIKGFNLLTQCSESEKPMLTVLGKIIGDSEMSASTLGSIISLHHRDKQFNFVGSVDASTAHLYLVNSDIVVLNTRYRTECQPLAIIAAMCEGKSIVASRHLAITSTLRDYPCIWIDNSFDPRSVLHSLVQACSVCRDKSYQNLLAYHSVIARKRFSSSRFVHELKEHLDA